MFNLGLFNVRLSLKLRQKSKNVFTRGRRIQSNLPFVTVLPANSGFISVSLPLQLFHHNCLSLCPRVSLQFLTNLFFLRKVVLTTYGLYSVYSHVAAFGLHPYVPGTSSEMCNMPIMNRRYVELDVQSLDGVNAWKVSICPSLTLASGARGITTSEVLATLALSLDSSVVPLPPPLPTDRRIF